VLGRIFGIVRKEVTGSWRKLNEELQNLCSLASISRAINQGG
jgi:hypothetical protein